MTVYDSLLFLHIIIRDGHGYGFRPKLIHSDGSIPAIDGFNVGVDIIEIDRFREHGRDSAFVRRVYTEREIEYCFGFADPAPHLASTFAGKEAVYKSISSVCELPVESIELLRAATGAPIVVLHGHYELQVRVSLSHSSSLAVAVALAFERDSTIDEESAKGQLERVVSELVQGE